MKTDSRLAIKAKGDGASEDTAAVRAAIRLASATGGGVVYFPGGDYRIIASSGPEHGNPLVVPSRVVLRGADSSASRLFVNDEHAASETDGIWTWGGIDFQGASQSGMTDLGIYAVNSSKSACALLWNRGSAGVRELFFNQLEVHLNNCKGFWFESTDQLLIQGSHFDSSSLLYGPIFVVGNSQVSFLDNKITYLSGRVQMQNSRDLVMQGNTLTRDAQNRETTRGTAIESGGVELSFGENIQVLNNTIQTLHAPADEFDDGEAIMSQQSNIQDVLDEGRANAITSVTLTDSSALWGSVTAARLSRFPTVVAILTGPATGEWRGIRDINVGTKTLMLRQPWNPIPEIGSLYSIFSWTLMHARIEGNTLIDNAHGIVLFDGCFDCIVRGNKLVNSREIVLRAVDEAADHSLYPEGRNVHQLVMNSKILNNTVSNVSGVRPAYIALDTEAFDAGLYRGMGMMDIQVAGNKIAPYLAEPSRAYPKQGEITQDGFFPCFLFGPAARKDPVTIVFQNIDAQNNTLSLPVTYRPDFAPLTTRACLAISSTH